MSPDVCVSTPEMMLSSVLLPHPDGPTIETKVWPRTSNEMWSRTRLLRAVPAPKVLQRSFTVRTAMFLASRDVGSAVDRRGRRRAGTAPPPWGPSSVGGVPPAEGAPRQPLQDELVEDDDHADEQHHPGGEAGELVGVVPVPGAVAGAARAAEPLGEEHAVPAHDHGEPEPGHDVAGDGGQDEVPDPPAERHAVGGRHVAQVPGDPLDPLRHVDDHEGHRGQERGDDRAHVTERSEEHTSELQSRQYLVCRLLLEKKNEHKDL